LGTNKSLFAEFFIPGQAEYGDKLDWALQELLQHQNNIL